MKLSVLLHKSDISQLSSESFNQMLDMASKQFIVDPEINVLTTNFQNYSTKQNYLQPLILANYRNKLTNIMSYRFVLELVTKGYINPVSKHQ